MTDAPPPSPPPRPGDASAPTEPEGGPGAVARARGFVGRARRVPGTIEELARSREGADARVTGALDEVRAALARVEQLGWDGRHDTRGGVQALGEELHRLRAHVDAVAERIDALDGAVAAHAAATRRVVEAPRRSAAARTLRESLGAAPELVPGLSVFTLCWNHGPLLAEAVRSGLAVLDRLEPDERGEVLVLDDASSDSTAEVAAALADDDPRVRVIRSETNLGLGHARTTLLHAARTRHALQLDADDVAEPAGVVELYRSALRTGAAITYGTVVQAEAGGEALGPVSNEPPMAGLFRSNYIGTIAVSDLAAYRALGGWPTDPLLEHVDDWASLHHLMDAGLLVAFVPVVAAEYREHPTGFHHTTPDPRLGQERLARVFDPTGRRRGDAPLEGIAAIAHHPSVGVLWATPEAIALDPSLAPSPPASVTVREPAARVLLVGPAGVANLGDDAITVRAVERARASFGPDVALDVVSDGPLARALPGQVRWLAPLTMAVHGLDGSIFADDDPVLAAGAERAGVGTARWRPLDLARYDAAVFLGCGLSSRWAEGTIVPRALLAAALRHARVPFAGSGQGYVMDDDGLDLLDAFVGGAVALGCRDATSATVARGLPGVDPDVVSITGDDALGLPAAGAAGAPAGFGPWLAVTVRRAEYVGDPAHDPVRRWARAADAVAADRGWDVLGVALNAQRPEPEIATLAGLRATEPLRARWHLVECGSDPGVLVAAVSAAAAVATQSYHAALFGLAAGVPTVLSAATPYYVAKAGGLAALAALPDAFAVDNPEALGAGLDAVTAALDASPRPLADAATATDAWWAALPAVLGVTLAT